MHRKQVDTNFFDPAFMEDPFPLYEQIRAVGNVVWYGPLAGWVVVGYDEAAAVLTDPGERFAILSGDPELTFWFEAPNMITVDGAYHHRLRAALAPLFTLRAVAKWEQRVGEVAAQLVAPLAAGDESVDLIAEFTLLPTVITADMLGVPEERYADFRRWSHEVVTNLLFGLEDDQGRAVLQRAAAEVNAYLREEVERHRREQPDDLLTYMLSLPGEDAMSDDEIRSTAVLLLLAGYDTTAKTMANCLIALERNPGQRQLVAADRGLVPAAIEEGMRWFGAVQWLPRRALRETTLDGMKVSAGENVYVLNAAANRDPRRWPDPGRFDVHRDSKTHLAFGYGPHLCLGARLARLETRVAIEQLLRVAPEYRLRDIDFGNSMFIRGPERGTVEAGPRVSGGSS